MVVRPLRALAFVADADEEERAGDFLQVEAEIFAAHRRLDLEHARLAEHFLADLRAHERHFRRVDRGRQVARVVEVGGAAEGRADVVAHALDERLAVLADLRLERSRRARQLHLAGDDVERAARFHDADGDDSVLERVQLAADERL